MDFVEGSRGDSLSISILSILGANGLWGAICGVVSYRRFGIIVGVGGGPMSSPSRIL